MIWVWCRFEKDKRVQERLHTFDSYFEALTHFDAHPRALFKLEDAVNEFGESIPEQVTTILERHQTAFVHRRSNAHFGTRSGGRVVLNYSENPRILLTDFLDCVMLSYRVTTNPRDIESHIKAHRSNSLEWLLAEEGIFISLKDGSFVDAETHKREIEAKVKPLYTDMREFLEHARWMKFDLEGKYTIETDTEGIEILKGSLDFYALDKVNVKEFFDVSDDDWKTYRGLNDGETVLTWHTVGSFKRYRMRPNILIGCYPNSDKRRVIIGVKLMG